MIEKIEKNASHCRIINNYGPTEKRVAVLTYLVKGKNQEASTVPIAKPLCNTHIYVLDTHLKPVPLGVAGELYIGSKSLAGGYVNSLELSKEKFINHAFNDRKKRL